MIVTQITVGAFQENCYLVEDPKTNAIAIVDPGSEPERIVDAIDKSGGRVEAIWITHAHVDHIGAIAPLKKKYNVPVWLHPLDEPLYRVGGRQAQLYGIIQHNCIHQVIHAPPFRVIVYSLAVNLVICMRSI